MDVRNLVSEQLGARACSTVEASFTLGMRAKNSNMFLKWRQRVQGTWDVLRSDIC